MKLNYQLQGNRLEGDNDITIKKLQLGEKVKSEQAKDLPLGLAVALLSDANGVIQMNLKVKGNLDQPDFSLGNIFWDVLGNTLRKAVTSPFSLLASLAGGSEDLDELPFLPGEPDLTPTQQEKLAKLAQALKDRPKLSMNIRGKVNFNEERPILQRQKLERALAKITGGPVDLELLEQDPAMQSALAQAYEARFNEDLGDLADRLKLDEESPDPARPGGSPAAGSAAHHRQVPAQSGHAPRPEHQGVSGGPPGDRPGAAVRAGQPGQGGRQGGQGGADPGRLSR